MNPKRLITSIFALSAHIIAIHAENPKDFTIESPVICRDPNANLAEAFGIAKGYPFHGETVHFPALVVLDGTGKELLRHAGRNNSDRMSVTGFSARLAKLLPATAPAARSSDPRESLPPHITRLTWFGERADWRHDGERFVFLNRAYGHVYEYEINDTENTDTFVLDLRNGTLTNMTRTLARHEECEGVFPDGHSTLVESTEITHRWPLVDLYRLWLDGSGRKERLTLFTSYRGWKAAEGVISDDGRFMLFQDGRGGMEAGQGFSVCL
jgi:hypothetical protein